MSKIKRKFIGKRLDGHRGGFTLAELLIVMMITVILAASAITGMLRSQATFLFKGAVQNVDSMVREARSLAVTGKAQIDYTDYDNDGCRVSVGDAAYPHIAPCPAGFSGPDYVTPANYGVHFDTTTNIMIMFADIHGSGIEGKYDGTPAEIGKFSTDMDIRLAEYSIPEKYSFILKPAGVDTVFYSPIFADTSFNDNTLVTDFFVFGIEEDDPGFRKNCSALHRISGVSESTQKTNTQTLCD